MKLLKKWGSWLSPPSVVPESTSGSFSPSTGNTEWAPAGPRRTETAKLFDVVARAQLSPFTVQSDFARENAAVVAQAATLGFIGTRRPDGSFGRSYMVTRKGALYLEQQQQEEASDA